MSYILNGMHVLRANDIDTILAHYKQLYLLTTYDKWRQSEDKAQYDAFLKGCTGKDANDTNILNFFSYETVKSSLIPNINVQLIAQSVTKLVNDAFIKYNSDNEYHYSICFSDIIQADICKRRTGFSGTPYFEIPYDRAPLKQVATTPVVNNEAEGMIYFSCVNQLTKIIPSPSAIDDIINAALTNNCIAIIDVGSFFIGISNKEVAQKIYNAQPTTPKNVVIYINEYDQKVVYENDGSKDTPYNDWMGAKEIAENAFIYFDQKHTVGIDFKLPLHATALLLLNHTNGARDFGQGAFRMRMLNNGQNIIIGISNTLAASIHFESSDTTGKNNYALLEHLIGIETTKKKQKEQLQAAQNIRAIYRQYCITESKSLTTKFSVYDYLDSNVFLQKSKHPPIKSIDMFDVTYEQYLADEIEWMVHLLKHKSSIRMNAVLDTLLARTKQQTLAIRLDRVQEQESEQVLVQEQEQEQEQEHINKLLSDDASLNYIYDIHDVYDPNASNVGTLSNLETIASGTQFVQLDGTSVFMTAQMASRISKLLRKDLQNTSFAIVCNQNPVTFLVVTMDEYEQIISLGDDEFKNFQIILNAEVSSIIKCIRIMVWNLMNLHWGNIYDFFDAIRYLVNDLNIYMPIANRVFYFGDKSIHNKILKGLTRVHSNYPNFNLYADIIDKIEPKCADETICNVGSDAFSSFLCGYFDGKLVQSNEMDECLGLISILTEYKRKCDERRREIYSRSGGMR